MKKILTLCTLVVMMLVMNVNSIVEARSSSRSWWSRSSSRSSSFSRSSSRSTPTFSRSTSISTTTTSRTSTSRGIVSPTRTYTTTRSNTARINKTFWNWWFGLWLWRSYYNSYWWFYNPMWYRWYNPWFYYYGSYWYFNNLWLTSWMLPSQTVWVAPVIPSYFWLIIVIFVPWVLWLLHYLWYASKHRFYIVLSLILLSIIF